MIVCPETAISNVSIARLVRLPLLNIPDPDDILFEEFAVRYVRGDLSQRGDGFPMALWRWTGLRRATVSNLVTIGGGWSAGSGVVFIRTRTNQNGALEWRNFRCSMYLPSLTGQDGTPISQYVDGFTDVSIRFAGLVLQ